MTRKDYIALAECIKDERGEHFAKPYGAMTPWEKGAYDAWNTIALSMCALLARDNPRFDRERFLKACGVQS